MDDSTQESMSQPGPSNPPDSPIFDDRILKMMKNMGYKPGTGLGKKEQGIVQPISVNTNLGVRGLGLEVPNLNYSTEEWDFSVENLVVEEQINWLYNPNKPCITLKEEWIVEASENLDVLSNTTFCDPQILVDVFKAKEIFDELDANELNLARARANPFETIRAMFFMNRAALKMVNIDAACDFMFTKLRNQDNELVYFADVCAGPGGFTEYILWRGSWVCKGFGMTLKDERDFKVSDSSCATSASFQCLYGVDGTGNVCNPSNLADFCDRVRHETGQGVHFMMSDGGFCVDGQEHLQEVLSKNIYICQCYLALEILRPKGHFVTKLFDVFTPFSVGLLFLMYLCFEKVGIIKPNTSRPANSERYLVCKNYHANKTTLTIKEYLRKVVMKFWELREQKERSIVELLPKHILTNDKDFFEYIYESNSSIGSKQIIALNKLASFCRNPNLVEYRQASMREKCLNHWGIPDFQRYSLSKVDKIRKILVLSGVCMGACVLLLTQSKTLISMILEDLEDPCTVLTSREINNIFSTVIKQVDDWSFMLVLHTDSNRKLHYYAGLGNNKSVRLMGKKWTKVSHLNLVRGTLLFGELIKETCEYEPNYKGYQKRYSLHVIDAIRLGDMDLRSYTYLERLKFIEMYCKSVNRESESDYSVRLRLKPIFPLREISVLSSEEPINLPLQGYKAVTEKYWVKSIFMFNAKEKTFLNISKQQFILYDLDWPLWKSTMKSLLAGPS